MALKFNPFEKDKPVATPVSQPKYSKLRVFDDPELAPVQPKARNEAQKAKTETKIHPLPVVQRHEQNREQSESKQEANREQNYEQTESKVGAIWEHEDNEKANWEQTGGKVGAQPGAVSGANQKQTGSKPGAALSVLSLTGLQRELIIFMADVCRMARSKVTRPISIEQLGRHLKTTPGTAKNAVKRLEQKGFLERVSFKNGRGGWSQYTLPQELYHEILHMESVSKEGANWEQTTSKAEAKQRAEPGALTSSNSSFNSLENSTTTDVQAFSERLQNACERFGLTDETIGVGANDLLQVWRRKVFATEAELLVSAEHIAFYLKNGGVSNLASKKAYVMSQLFQGYYGKPANFISWEERQELARIEIAKQRHAKSRSLRFERFTLEFKNWLDETPRDELIKLLMASAEGRLAADDPRSMRAQGVLQKIFAKQQGEDMKDLLGEN